MEEGRNAIFPFHARLDVQLKDWKEVEGGGGGGGELKEKEKQYWLTLGELIP